MITWGIVGNSHDASIAVFDDARKGLGPNQSTRLMWAGLAQKTLVVYLTIPDLNDAIVEQCTAIWQA